MPDLNRLWITNNHLETIDISGNPELIYLWVGQNNLDSLIVSNLTKLIYFYCYFNNLTTLDVSNSPNLVWLYCYENNITSMMRTTAYPTSIIAQMIGQNIIEDRGVFCSEEIVSCEPFFKELEKRNIKIQKAIK